MKRLTWYDHVLRREKDYVERRVLNMVVEGGLTLQLSSENKYQLVKWYINYERATGTSRSFHIQQSFMSVVPFHLISRSKQKNEWQ